MHSGKGFCEISIIVPVYNGDYKIQRCLDAVLSEDLSQSEVIVIDNGSTDKTQEQLLSYQKLGVEVYQMGPPSRGLARQFGIDKSVGKVVVMVDCDCVVKPGWLHEITKSIFDGKAKIVIGKTIGVENSYWGNLAAAAERSFFFQPNEFGQPFNFTSTHFAAARSCLDFVGFDSRFAAAEDFDFGIQCALKGIKMEYCESAVATHFYLDNFKGQMLKSLSRGFWSYLVFKKYSEFDMSFKNQIRKNKGLEYFRPGYTLVWAIARTAKLLNANSKKRKIMVYEIFYELAWQSGVFYARCAYFVKKVGRSKVSVLGDLALKDL